MSTHGAAAKAARLAKERHPEKWCPARGCLWRLNDDGSNPCPKHGFWPFGMVVHACPVDEGPVEART